MTCVRGFAGAAAQGPVGEAHAGADSVPVAGVTNPASGTSIDLPLSLDLSLQISVLLDDLPVEDGFGHAAAEICLFGDDEELFGWDMHEDETDPRHGFAGSVDDGVEDVLGHTLSPGATVHIFALAHAESCAATPPVFGPLPAAAPLAALGLGAPALVGRRRRA